MTEQVHTALDHVTTALRDWAAMNRHVPGNTPGVRTSANNLVYLLAFLEANDDLFDRSFRREVAEASGAPIEITSRKDALEAAADAAREEERHLTYGGGVAPDGYERLPAFVSVDRALASAPSSARRRAIRMSWDRSLRTDSAAVERLAREVAAVRRGASGSTAHAGADAFIRSFSAAVARGAQMAFSRGNRPFPSLLAAATAAMEEGPGLMLARASQVREPMLDVDLVRAHIVTSLRTITGADVHVRSQEDRWTLTFIFPFTPEIVKPGSVIVWLLPSGPNAERTAPDTDPRAPEHVAADMPVAHVGLRSAELPSGRRVMHLRDLRATLHELGHALHHALTADLAPLRHGLESAGVTEIDLLSVWQEWSVFDAGWSECVLAATGACGSALSVWQDLLRMETLKELPLRALVVALDHAWAQSPQDRYKDVWRQVTQSSPEEHSALYMEALHRLTWPIPTARPGGEFGLFWAMSEVAQQRSAAISGGASLPQSWVQRILGAPAETAPDPRTLIRFLLPAGGEHPLPDRTPPVTEETMNSTAYPSDYIAAMLPDREPALTDVLRRALVEDQFPPIQIDDNAARLLECLTLIARPKLAIEIGALFGYSTIHLARGLRSGGRLISYEIDQRAAASTRDNVRRLGLSDRVEVSTDDAVTAIPLLGPEAVDLIFIDGAKTEYVSYLKAAFPALAPGGVLIVDDAFAGGTYTEVEGVEDTHAGAAIRQVVHALARSAQVTVSFLGTENGMLLAVKNGVDDE